MLLRFRLPLVLSLILSLALAAAPLAAFTIYLKDGATIDAERPYEVRGDEALITLRNGTQTSLPLAEIDVTVTERNNKGGLSDALVLQNGQLVDLETARQAGPERETLGTRIVRGETTLSARLPAPAGAVAATLDPTTAAPARRELDDPATRLLRSIFASESVAEVGIYAGSGAASPRVEVTTDTEAGVFRGLLVAAVALERARAEPGQGLQAVELRFVTGQGRPGGDFLLTPELAAELTSSRLAPSDFYVRYVQF